MKKYILFYTHKVYKWLNAKNNLHMYICKIVIYFEEHLNFWRFFIQSVFCNLFKFSLNIQTSGGLATLRSRSRISAAFEICAVEECDHRFQMLSLSFVHDARNRSRDLGREKIDQSYFNQLDELFKRLINFFEFSNRFFSIVNIEL